MQLPGILKTPAVAILGDKCYVELVENLNITDVPCLKYAISKGLGFGIVAGGSIVKVPQILKIVQGRSARGLSLSSYILETFAYLVTLAYNLRAGNPFSTFGESFFITIQDIIILALILFYGRQTMGSVLAVVTCAVAFYALYDPSLVSESQISILYAANVPIVLMSRIPQILSNYKNGNTGQLSAFTIFNYFAGAAARVFTTLQEVDDNIMLAGFLLSSIVNGILALQMVYYWNATSKADAKKKAKIF
ncbi:monosaccharide-P-dolichol utilization protein [Basidiobolus meristosporus CBS 931.73]|uniref:Mannose-P-dolichol utilization defect 1 protein homolog n=1 Tax=Basidiobolus meristosporus CBS 931.73 TaxID=1314790 RepID=A0A1Y1XXG8_9FUNG|nr:monosaccharide-P-dolichol utilization protein [Basidiobolus meristosporus CBS 931.73]|eukprot:ORX90443.1 monosaccharide-P-dolichol utilization protein [Basidiobolus meristosporus CBS 931.73]